MSRDKAVFMNRQVIYVVVGIVLIVLAVYGAKLLDAPPLKPIVPTPNITNNATNATAG